MAFNTVFSILCDLVLQESQNIVLYLRTINRATLICYRMVTYPESKLWDFGIWQFKSANVVMKTFLAASKVYGANTGPIWGRQDPGGPHVGPMNFAIWVAISMHYSKVRNIDMAWELYTWENGSAPDCIRSESYIYIHICVCVCVCVCHILRHICKSCEFHWYFILSHILFGFMKKYIDSWHGCHCCFNQTHCCDTAWETIRSPDPMWQWPTVYMFEIILLLQFLRMK